MKKTILSILLTTLAIIALSAPVGIQSITAAGVKKQITANKGKVVLINFFATWCGPCVREFPDLVKLYNNYKKKGVVVIAVSVDDKADKKEVEKFLKNQKATFKTYLADAPDLEKFISSIDKDWKGEIPRTYIYNKKGKLHASFSGSHDYKYFETEVKKAMK